MCYLDQLEALPEVDRWPRLREWMRTEPLPLYAELRERRPVLELPDLVLVTRHSDCVEILARHDLFSVAPYVPKQGEYWMAQDDTARHWREKSIMRAILDFERVPEMRAWVEDETARRLDAANGQVEAVAEITRGVPIALVQHWFGLTGADPKDMFEWSYWNQMDAFWNQPFDDPGFATADEIVERREAANDAMRDYLVALVTERAAALKAGEAATDMVSRLLVLSASGALRFDVPLAVLNAGGLLIGAVETTSHAVVNALRVLCDCPERKAAAIAAARASDPGALDGHVYEALRFRPAFPYFFRRAEAETRLARGTAHETTVQSGRMVLAVTHSAMFDASAVTDPHCFDPGRGLRGTFTFGYGLHECLGRAVGAAMIPAIVRRALLLENLQAAEVEYCNGPVPEAWSWTW